MGIDKIHDELLLTMCNIKNISTKKEKPETIELGKRLVKKACKDGITIEQAYSALSYAHTIVGLYVLGEMIGPSPSGKLGEHQTADACRCHYRYSITTRSVKSYPS